MSSSTHEMPAIMPRQTMRGHTEEVRCAVHLPSEKQIITCSWDGSLRLWDLENGTQIGEEWLNRQNGNDTVWSMALSPNGQIIVTGSGINYDIRLWDVEKRNMIIRCTGHTNVVCALCWSADGERIASGSWDGTARVWDVTSGMNILTIKTGHYQVWAVTYSPDSSKLATGGIDESAVKIWDAKTGELLITLKHHNIVLSLGWTSDGKKLISGSYGPIRIFDTATWLQIAILKGHTRHVNAISLSSNNRLLASASIDTTTRLWNLDTNLPVGPPLQHEHYRTTRVWYLDTNPPVSRLLQPEHYVNFASFSRNGKVLVTACTNNNAYSWDVHAILKEAVLEDLLLIGTNVAPEDRLKEKATDESGIQRIPRSSIDNKSFLEACATQCPDQFDGVDQLPPAFFAGMKTNSSMGGHHHSSANAFLARFSSHRHRSRLNTGEGAKSHPTMPLSSRPDALITRLSSRFRSQPHTNEEIELAQRPSRPRVIEVAAVRDKQALVVARGPKFMKAFRAHLQQSQSHAQAQASSSHTQPVGASTSATHPAPGTAAAQPPSIRWWTHIVLFLCCTSPHAEGH
ncbi:hypothetical protein CY34DRAFT_495923 [Suillus luteus UH-Slu-Lm8-n1]|uniref:Anaphase-promoting complex subunit 4 WD40 domain-containing protein n=1 Tax=Suillus luteus UH-Slu-Lm8-n1 TaxID=930992 RepID=A0A0D0A6N0_9AGAM|nr:hypothetical protein CY34DRAFT_495923 [Suillus luteus UH-Slu-Lm8-n1]